MKKILKEPFTYLGVQAAFLITALSAVGYFVPAFFKDTNEYVNFFPSMDFGTEYLRFVFSGFRTIGYPLFLKAVSTFSPDFGLLPEIQMLLHIGIVFIFMASLLKFGINKWMSLAVASCLLYEKLVLYDCMMILPESLSVSMNVLTVALVFFAVARPRGIACKAAFALCVFAAYNLRPENISLILLAPVFAFLLIVLKNNAGWKAAVRPAGALAMKLFALGFVPFVLFCGFRLALVGDFGPTSFAGINVIGITGQLLDEHMVPDLPDDVQPLARTIIQKREEMKLPTGYTSLIHHDVGLRGGYYAIYIWRIAIPAALQIYNEPEQVNRYIRIYNGFQNETLRTMPNALLSTVQQMLIDDVRGGGFVLPDSAKTLRYRSDDRLLWVKTNKKVTKLSLQIINRKPLQYAYIVFHGFLDGVVVGMDMRWRLNRLLYLLVFGWLVSWLVSAVAIRALPCGSIQGKQELLSKNKAGLIAIVLVGLIFTAVKIFMVSLVEMPVHRYIFAAEIFLTSLFAAAACWHWLRYFILKSNDNGPQL